MIAHFTYDVGMHQKTSIYDTDKEIAIHIENDRGADLVFDYDKVKHVFGILVDSKDTGAYINIDSKLRLKNKNISRMELEGKLCNDKFNLEIMSWLPQNKGMLFDWIVDNLRKYNLME